MTATPISKEAHPAPGAGQVLSLAWPMTLKAIFLHGTVVIDGWLVSSLGETSLAAMGLAAALGGFVSGVVFAFSNALQIRTAQAYGTKDPLFMKSVLVSGLSLGVSIGIMGVISILAFGQTVLGMMAPNPTMAAQAWSYLSIFSFVILAEAVGQNLGSHFNGCGRTRLPLYGYCLSVPVNILASVVLIHGYFGMPAFGVAGAAMGSAIAILIQASFLSLQLWRLDGHLWHIKGWRNGSFFPTVKRHMAFSWPIAITFVSSNFASRFSMLIFSQMSIAAFAAMTLIMPWIMVAGTIGMQWAQASGIIVAQLLGEKRSEAVLDRFLSSAWRAAFVNASLVSMVYLGLCLSPNLLYPQLAAETRSILTSFAFVLLVLPFPKQSNAMCGNTLRASGDTIYVMHIFIWSQWLFRIPVTAFAVLILDVHPVWVLSLMFWEELLKFPFFHRRLWRGDWKTSDVSVDSPRS
ncbi:MAG: MATE family efflux transporter [Pseudoruegeria sp.]